VNQNKIKVYPNPASEKLQIVSNFETFRSIFLKIYNLQGQLVLTQAIKKGRTSVDISKLVQGYYIYSVKIEDAVVSTGKLSVIR